MAFSVTYGTHEELSILISVSLCFLLVCVCVSVSPSMQVCIGTVKARGGTRSPGVRLAGGSELPGVGAGN